MTRDDVMALSGRELDAAVAERIFKWQRHDRHMTIGFHGQKVRKCLLCGSEVDWVEDDYFCGHHTLTLPAYSTSWDVMGALIEHMRGLGWRRKVTEYSDGLYIKFAKERIDAAGWQIEQWQDECDGTARAALLAVCGEG